MGDDFNWDEFNSDSLWGSYGVQWGSTDIEAYKKGLTLIMPESGIDHWLDSILHEDKTARQLFDAGFTNELWWLIIQSLPDA